MTSGGLWLFEGHGDPDVPTISYLTLKGFSLIVLHAQIEMWNGNSTEPIDRCPWTFHNNQWVIQRTMGAVIETDFTAFPRWPLNTSGSSCNLIGAQMVSSTRRKWALFAMGKVQAGSSPCPGVSLSSGHSRAECWRSLSTSQKLMPGQIYSVRTSQAWTRCA